MLSVAGQNERVESMAKRPKSSKMRLRTRVVRRVTYETQICLGPLESSRYTAPGSSPRSQEKSYIWRDLEDVWDTIQKVKDDPGGVKLSDAQMNDRLVALRVVSTRAYAREIGQHPESGFEKFERAIIKARKRANKKIDEFKRENVGELLTDIRE